MTKEAALPDAAHALKRTTRARRAGPEADAQAPPARRPK
jgi:hypothetical protein